jgi:hypothetical protein
VYEQHPRNEIIYKKCHKWINVDLENSETNIISITVDGEKRDTNFDCRLKGGKQTVLHSNRRGPAP